uniref:Uncharacterized protein n=1 Tax=uncultured marine virus TaxID=186617 RepID=A0A0F7L7U3_9VIRU|nr:hypothetical protein [uncultured marine virus]
MHTTRGQVFHQYQIFRLPQTRRVYFGHRPHLVVPVEKMTLREGPNCWLLLRRGIQKPLRSLVLIPKHSAKSSVRGNFRRQLLRKGLKTPSQFFLAEGVVSYPLFQSLQDLQREGNLKMQKRILLPPF